MAGHAVKHRPQHLGGVQALGVQGLTRSFIIRSWLTGTRAIRDTNASTRTSSSDGAGASMASPHSAASAPDSESPVKSSRLARCGPSRYAHIDVVGEPHTRAGG
jgi:hypothetical protein